MSFLALGGNRDYSDEEEANYFSRMDYTLFTLFQFMCFDDWADVARGIMAEKSWAWVPIIAWCLISGFVVANLFIAVICESLVSLDEIEKKNIEGNMNRTTMRGVSLETDGPTGDAVVDDEASIDPGEYISKLQNDILTLQMQQEKLMTVLQKFEERNNRN